MRKILVWLNKDLNTYLFLLVGLILDRIFLLIHFNFKYTGSDDLVFWLGATDYLNGKFHEPYFYGQNYNFMLESVLAVPFLALNFPYQYTFPICSSIIGLFPFILFSFVLFKKGFKVEGICFLLIPLALPIEHGILTSITRGFTSGLFFTGLLAIPLINPDKKSSWFIATLSASIGFIFNPNSVIFSLPILLYLLLTNGRKWSYYIISLVSVIPAFLIEYNAKAFYVHNPKYAVHRMLPLKFDSQSILKNIPRLDNFFSYLTPVFWSFGWLIVVAILLLGIYLLKNDWKKGICLIISFLLILFSLGINKVNDQINSIFLSSVRMYLGVPLLAGLAFFWSRNLIKISDSRLKYGMLIVALTVLFCKFGIYPAVVKKHLQTTNYGPVAIKRMDKLICECSSFNFISAKEDVDLIVFVPNDQFNVPHMEFYNYGCPLLQKDLPKTMMNVYERRTWVYLEEKQMVEKTILIYNFRLDSNQTNHFGTIKTISEEPKVTLVKDCNITLDSLLQVLQIPLRRTAWSK